MQVFVLTKEVVNGMCDITRPSEVCRVYSTFQEARKVLSKEYFDEMKLWDKSTTHFDNEVDSEESCAEIYEEGRYVENHVSWNIYKRDIV